MQEFVNKFYDKSYQPVPSLEKKAPFKSHSRIALADMKNDCKIDNNYF